jgi:hypothetical protein
MPDRRLLILWSHPPGLNRRPADYEFCYQCLMLLILNLA